MMVAPSTAAAPLAPVGAAVRAVTAFISPAPRSTRSPHTLQLDVDGLDQLDDAVLALDERQRITYCNAAAERMYGFRAAEAAGLPFRDLVDGPSNGSARGGTHVGAWLSSGAATHVTTSGRSVPVYVTVIPCGGEGAAWRHLLIVRDDVESQRLAESAEEEFRFGRFVAAMSARFSILSEEETDAEIELWLRRLIGFLDVDRSSFWELLPGGAVQITHSYAGPGVPRQLPVLANGQFPWLARELAAGRPVVIERMPDELPGEATLERQYFIEQGMKSGVAIPISIGHQVVCVLSVGAFRARRAWSAHVIARLHLVGDVFANAVVRRQAKRRLEQKQQELTHVGRVAAMGQLASVIAHELDQPLTAVISNAEAIRFLLDAEKPDLIEVDAALEDVIDAGLRVSGIIKRERRLLRKQNAGMGAGDLSEFVRDIELFIRADARRAGARLVLELLPGLPMVLADRIQMQQVILNLTHNGLQAMQNRPRDTRVLRIRTAARSKEVVLSVIDAGPAVADDTVEKMFQPFFTTKADGMGVGLSISKTIVEGHRGRISATRNPGGGLTLQVAIPRMKEHHVVSR